MRRDSEMREHWKLQTTSTAREEDETPGALLGEVEDIFNTKDEALEELNLRYPPQIDRTGMWRDRKGGDPIQVGWVFTFEERDISHGGNPWIQEDWVQLFHVWEEHIIPEGMEESI